MKHSVLLLSSLFIGLALTGCGDKPAPAASAPQAEVSQASKANDEQYQEKTTGLANPGAEYCAKLGGEYKIVETADGQRGDCHLPDGRVEDAMALFRGHASAGDAQQAKIGMPNPAAEYCVKIGGEHKIVKEEAGEVGYCHLQDGQVVNAWEYFRAHHKQQ